LKIFLRGFAALFFVAAGVLHFLFPAPYMRMMPPLLPEPRLLVALSGAAEIVLGVLLLNRRLVWLAGWGLIALLVAVFPANVYLALHPEIFPRVSAWIWWARLPLQAVFILWIYEIALRRRF
jgi:uncharacterized membrane protein